MLLSPCDSLADTSDWEETEKKKKREKRRRKEQPDPRLMHSFHTITVEEHSNFGTAR